MVILFKESLYTYILLCLERLAFCGKAGHISFELPFTTFLPNQQKVLFSAHVSENYYNAFHSYFSQGQNIVVRRYFPPSCVFKESVFALSSCSEDRWRLMEPPDVQTLHPLTRSASQPIEPYQSKRAKSGDRIEKPEFKKTHRRLGSEPVVSNVGIHKKALGRNSESVKEKPSSKKFPMGCCMSTSYEAGWLDLGCGPSITIDVVFHNHNSDMTHVPLKERMVSSQIIVNVDIPCVLLRVFGTLARDLLALKVNNDQVFSCLHVHLIGKLSWRVHVFQNVFITKP